MTTEEMEALKWQEKSIRLSVDKLKSVINWIAKERFNLKEIN